MNGEILDRRPAEPVAVADGRYRIGQEIGRGGKARVFLARDTLLRREVAVKVFRARAEDPDELRIQEAEAKLIASLNHFALTTLFDAGADTSDPDHPQIYLVMEHITGGDLRARVRRGPVDVLQVAYLGFDLAEGLHYLHESGFLHRDIKPANVLLARRGEDVRLRGKLADFGISSLIGSVHTGESVTGTAAYLSPEQAEGNEAGPASDVYSLGLVLLEALTGRVAFPGDIPTSALARLDRDPEIPVAVAPQIAAVLRGMTARSPEDRMRLTDVIAGFQNLIVDTLLRQRDIAPAAAPEEGRLQAVRRFGILDSPAEDAFDDVTDLICRTLHVPVALVVVVDEDRSWFKSRRGVPLPEVSREVTREFAATGGSGTWNIPDTFAVPSLRSHPFVAGEPGVRSALAAPLVTHDGHAIGRILAGDLRPREFDADEVATIEAFSRIVMRELELRLASRRALFER